VVRELHHDGAVTFAGVLVDLGFLPGPTTNTYQSIGFRRPSRTAPRWRRYFCRRAR
jgi:hypothetical protein